MTRRSSRAGLEPFIELNDKEKADKAAGKKTSSAAAWKHRYALIKEHFPIVDRIDWMKAFEDKELYGRLWREILSVDQAKTAGQGPRPALDQERARERLRQLMGNDYSYLSFHESFNILIGKRSIRNVANKLGMAPTMIFNLKHGVKDPDLYELETIAKGFGKHPSYFLEYRVAFIVAAIGEHMLLAPETTVDVYRRLGNQTKLGG